MRTTLVVLAFMCLAGCQMAATPQPRYATFNPAEYEPYKAKGTASINGQAFLVTTLGDVKYGAGRTVVLNPVTSYSTEWYERLVKNGELLVPGDSRGFETHWQCVADAEGRFKFEGLPAGSYYIFCPIYWIVPNYGEAGGNVCARVDLVAGEAKQLILNRPAFVK